MRTMMPAATTAALLLTITAAAAPRPAASQPGAPADSRVVINGATLSAEILAQIEAGFRVRIQPGAYWYDRACGAWGVVGGPTAGFVPAGLAVGGPTLAEDASGGDMPVWVNGRRLHRDDVAALQALLGPVTPGRYWLDAYGNVGAEGGPAMLNLVQLAAARGGGGGGSISRSNITGIGTGSDGSTSYVIGKDWSVVTGP